MVHEDGTPQRKRQTYTYLRSVCRVIALIKKFRLGFHDVEVLPDVYQSPQPERCVLIAHPGVLIMSTMDRLTYCLQLSMTPTFDSVRSSVHRFEKMLDRFRLDTNPKQDCDSGSERQQEEPWRITEQDLERNRAKVRHTHGITSGSIK